MAAPELVVTARLEDQLSGGIDDLSSKLSNLGKGLAVGGTAVGGAVAGIGAAVLSVGMTFDDAFDSIRIQTGATGDKLAGLQESFRAVFASVPADAATVSAAIGTLAQRTGATGQVLEGLTTQIVNLSRVAGVDATAAANAAADVFARWSVSAEQQGPLLDRLFSISQQTGVGFGELASRLSAAAPQMRAIGMSADEAASLLGGLGARGIDASAVMSSLTKFAREQTQDLDSASKAAGAYSKAQDAVAKAQENLGKAQAKLAEAQAKHNKAISEHGAGSKAAESAAKSVASATERVTKAHSALEKAQTQAGASALKLREAQAKTAAAQGPLEGALANVFAKIKELGPGAEANKLAFEAFGKQGLMMADQIASGSLSLEDLVSAFGGTGDAINAAAADTDDFGQKWQVFKNQLMLAIEPSATKLMDALGAAMDRLAPLIPPVADALGRLVGWLAENPVIAVAVAAFGALGGAVGAVMAVAGPFIPVLMSVSGAIGSVISAAGGFGAILGGLAALFNPVGIAIAAIVAAVVGMKLAWDSNLGGIRDTVAAIWDNIIAAFGAAVAFVGQHVDTLKTVLLTIITGGWYLVYQLWVKHGDAIKAAVSALVTAIKQKWEDIRSATLAAWNAVRAAVIGAVDAVRARVGEVLASIGAVWATAWDGITVVAQAAWDTLVATVTSVLDSIGGLVDAGISAVVDMFSEGGDAIREVCATVWESLRGIVEAGIEFVRAVIRAGMQALSGDWRGAWETVSSAAREAVSRVTQVLGGLVSYLGDLARDCLARATEIGSNIATGIREALTGAWGALVEKLRSLVSLLPEAVKKLLGIASPSRVFAQIGEWIVAGLALGIDAGREEAVRSLAAVVSAIKTVISDAADALAAVTRLSETEITAGLGATVDAIGAVILDLAGRIDALDRAMSSAGLDAGRITDQAEITGRVAAAVQGIVDAVVGLAGVRLPAADVLGRVEEMAIRLAGVASSIGERFSGDAGLAGFSALSDAIRAAADALGAIAGIDLVGITRLTAEQLDIAGTNIRRAGAAAAALVSEWIAAVPDKAARLAGLAPVKAFSDLVGAISSIVRAGDLGDLSRVAAVTASQMDTISANVRAMGRAVGALLAEWVSAAGDEHQQAVGIAALSRFGSLVSGIVGVVRSAAIGEIDAALTVNLDAVRGVLSRVRDELAPMIQAIADAWVTANENAAAMIDRMKLFSDWVSAALGLARLSEIGQLRADLQVNIDNLPLILDYLRTDLVPTIWAIVERWDVAGDAAGKMVDRMKSFSDTMSAAVGVARVSEIGEIRAGVLVNMPILTAILGWLRDTFAPAVAGIVEAWGETAESSRPLVDRMTAFGAVIRAAVEIAKSADIGSLAGSVAPANLPAKLEVVRTNVLAIYKLVGEIARDIGLEEARARADLSEAIGRIMQGVGEIGGGIEGLLSLAESRLFGADVSSRGGLSFAQRTRGRRADAFAEHLADTVRRAIRALQDAMGGINIVPDDPRIGAIRNLGEAFSALAEGLTALAGVRVPNAGQIAALVNTLSSAISPARPAAATATAGVGGGGGGSIVLTGPATLTGPLTFSGTQIVDVYLDGSVIERSVTSGPFARARLRAAAAGARV